MPEYRDHYYTSPDGLRLYARDYPHDKPRATILCMHGLTRNSADFEGIAAHLAQNYRLLIVDQRGRGRSEYDSNIDNYQPAVYVQDMFKLLDELQLDKVMLMGTSMGGLMSMIMVAMQPQRFTAVIMNDIGPEIAPEGLARIKGYVGKTAPATSWEDAAEKSREINGAAFPDYTDADWMRFARATYREDESGVPRLAYDPAIAQPMQENQDAAVPPDLWPLFEAMANTPLLLIRGEITDILAPECVSRMQAIKPDMDIATIPGRGHAPILDEPECIAAIDGFLARQ
jgi:pimeloyl-ACP methyl ester carboxylesterase